MKKLFALFKILFKSTYGISMLGYKASKNKIEILKVAGLVTAVILSVLPIFIGYVLYIVTSYDSFLNIGQPGAVITLGVLSSSMIVLFFGFFLVISTFYFTSDTEHLLSIPLYPSQILGAKLAVILLSEYLTELPLVLPPIIIYGIKSGAGVLYWIYSVILVLLIPVIPLCIASIISIALMRVTNIGRKRDLYRTVGAVISVLLLLGVQMYIQKAAISGGPEKITQMLFAPNGLINIMSKGFPPAAWVSIALIEYNTVNGFAYFILFIGVSLFLLTIFEYLGEKFFLGGYLGSQEIAAKRIKLDEREFARQTNKRTKMMAIFSRELKLLFRTPAFFMNCILPIVLIPAMFFMIYFTSGKSMPEEFMNTLNSPGAVYVKTLISAGVGILSVAISMVAPTSISREGTLFYISKYIPVSPVEQIRGKFIHAATLAVLGNILAVFTLGFLIKLTIPNLIISLFISSAAIAPIIATGFMIDLFRPLLIWDNPQKAVKNNLNGVISMFFNMIWAGGFIFIVGNYISNYVLAYFILIFAFSVLGFFLYRFMLSYAQKRYNEIEI